MDMPPFGAGGGTVDARILILLLRLGLLLLTFRILLGLNVSIVPTLSLSSSREARNTPAFVSTPEKRLPTTTAAAVMCEITGMSPTNALLLLLLLSLLEALILEEAS